MMTLHGIAGSPRTWQAQAVAAQLGVPLAFAPLDVMAGALQSSAYRALNPSGRTPTLVDGDVVLWETEAICQYLCGKAPSTLWPDDARLRAEITQWVSWQLQHFGKEACTPLVFERVVKPMFNLGAADAAVMARATASFHKEARVLEAHLATRSYMVGGQLTLADFSVAMPLLLAGPAELPVGDYPQMRGFLARMAALPAFRTLRRRRWSRRPDGRS